MIEDREELLLEIGNWLVDNNYNAYQIMELNINANFHTCVQKCIRFRFGEFQSISKWDYKNLRSAEINFNSVIGILRFSNNFRFINNITKRVIYYDEASGKLTFENSDDKRISLQETKTLWRLRV